MTVLSLLHAMTLMLQSIAIWSQLQAEDMGHGDHVCTNAVLVDSRSGRATEPVDNSCGTLAAG